MYFTILIGFVALVFLLGSWWFKSRIKLHDVPGLARSPFMSLSRPDPSKVHTYVYGLTQQYGKIMKIPYVDGNDILILSDYDAIYQINVLEGKKFGGRPLIFRTSAILSATGILVSHKPDATWKSLRQTTQRHLRQFGDGLSRLESIIVDIAGDMFKDFEGHVGKPYDPRQVVFDTALNSIAFLIIGRRTKTGDLVVEQMREYEELFLRVLSNQFRYMIMDAFPWLRHFGWPGWNDFERVLELESDIWSKANEYVDKNPGTESICKVMMDHIAEGDPNITETDATKATLSLLLAGVTTTSNSFYGGINILAHHQDIQEKMFREIEQIQLEKGREPNLQDRPNMPYTRACLFEILRETSVVAQGVTHLCLEDGSIQGHKIPSGTMIAVSIWSLHHDADFWEEPHTFNPERFLDEDGQLHPADHPNRKHLMPFGAGTRVCLGESLAMTRLFLWLVMLVRKFKITPAEGNKKSSIDSRNANLVGVLKPVACEVIFEPRE